MTITKQIEAARKFLPENPGAYARAMSGAIRAAMSARADKAFRSAIAADHMQAHFTGLNTSSPTAK